MTENTRKTFLHPIAFGELSKGGSVQIHQVCVGDTPDTARATGVMRLSTKQTSSSAVTEQFFVGRLEFSNIADALAAWDAM